MHENRITPVIYSFEEHSSFLNPLNTAHLISIDNIETLNSDENGIEYYIEAALQFIYELKNGGKIQDTINVGINVKMLDDATYSVEDAYRTDEDETESES